MSVETAGASSATPSDEALLAEITPAMLTKLKADSRQQAINTGCLLGFGGMSLTTTFAKQFDGVFYALLSLLGLGISVCGAVIMLRSFHGLPSMLRDELRYRRQHGKWRWER